MKYVLYLISRPVARGASAPPVFDRSVNPISTRGGTLSPPNTTSPPGFSDLVTALHKIQLNEFETDPYFLQNFQSNATVLIIHVFCKSCKPEIFLPVLQIKKKSCSLTKPVNNKKKLLYVFYQKALTEFQK